MKLPTIIANKKELKRDLIFICLIVILPFCFFIYNVVPENTSVWKTKLFTINIDLFFEVSEFFWLLFNKGLTIAILSIWFVSCVNRWRLIIIIPIIFEFYKLFVILHAEIFNSEIEGNSFLYSLMTSLPFIIVLHFFAKKLNFYKPNETISDELNTEINQQIMKLSKFNPKDYKSVKKEMDILVKEKKSISKKVYLAKLIALRDRLT